MPQPVQARSARPPNMRAGLSAAGGWRTVIAFAPHRADAVADLAAQAPPARKAALRIDHRRPIRALVMSGTAGQRAGRAGPPHRGRLRTCSKAPRRRERRRADRAGADRLHQASACRRGTWHAQPALDAGGGGTRALRAPRWAAAARGARLLLEQREPDQPAAGRGGRARAPEDELASSMIADENAIWRCLRRPSPSVRAASAAPVAAPLPLNPIDLCTRTS